MKVSRTANKLQCDFVFTPEIFLLSIMVSTSLPKFHAVLKFIALVPCRFQLVNFSGVEFLRIESEFQKR